MTINKITKSPTPVELLHKVNELVEGVNAPGYTLPVASVAKLGGVKVDGTSITVDELGRISAAQKSSVNTNYPSWWFGRGDGSLGDKVCISGEVLHGAYQYRSFLVPAGVTVYIELSAVIMCTESFTVLGEINGVGRGAWGAGAYGGSGGNGGACNNPSESSASLGGGCTYAEQLIGYTGSPSEVAIKILSYCDTAVFFGAAGGVGGYGRSPVSRGGAGIKIITMSFVNSGVINLSGSNGAGGWNVSSGKYSGGNGGGGGGALFVAANSISNTGAIYVAGGIGGASGGSSSKNGNAGYPGFFHLAEVGI